MADEPPSVLYRLVRNMPPTQRDFMSHEALGVPPRRPLSDEDRRLWKGVSHFDSLDVAFTRGMTSPWLGDFVATVHIPVSAAAHIEQTGRDPSHFTVWSTAESLLSWVASVDPIERVH
jgi:hypothetical protein